MPFERCLESRTSRNHPANNSQTACSVLSTRSYLGLVHYWRCGSFGNKKLRTGKSLCCFFTLRRVLYLWLACVWSSPSFARNWSWCVAPKSPQVEAQRPSIALVYPDKTKIVLKPCNVYQSPQTQSVTTVRSSIDLQRVVVSVFYFVWNSWNTWPTCYVLQNHLLLSPNCGFWLWQIAQGCPPPWVVGTFSIQVSRKCQFWHRQCLEEECVSLYSQHLALPIHPSVAGRFQRFLRTRLGIFRLVKCKRNECAVFHNDRTSQNYHRT